MSGEPAFFQLPEIAKELGAGETPALTPPFAFDPTLPPGEVTVPQQFADYEIIAPIARGGMGMVYKARQKKLNRTVALKTILAGQLADEQEVRRFYAEAEAAAVLDHPNIVPVYEVGQFQGQHYFSMGFVDGGNLETFVADHPLPARAAADLIKTVTHAIAYAHERGIIHRDLKPANILLQKSGSSQARNEKTATSWGGGHFACLLPKVTDFGLARRVEADSDLTATGQVLGTPNYMSPEQASGQTDRVGALSDVYSLGAVLYYLLTGRPPFEAGTVIGTLHLVIESDPVPVRAFNPHVAADLETICLKCLEKEPSRRYASARELADELERFLAGQPIVARPVSSTERFWRLCRRRPLVTSLATVAIAALVVGTIVSTYFAVRSSASAQQARRSLARSELALKEAQRQRSRADHNAQKLQEALFQTRQEKARADEARSRAEEQQALANERLLLAERAAYNLQLQRVSNLIHTDPVKAADLLEDERFCQVDRREFVWRYYKRLAHPERLELGDHSRHVETVAFSPDGRLIGSGTFDHAVKLWNAVTGELVADLEGHWNSVHDVTFSPDGRYLVSTGYDAQIIFWDIDQASQLEATSQDETPHPVAFILNGGEQGFTHIDFSPDGRWLAAGSYDKTVWLWDVVEQQCVRKLSGHEGTVTSVKFSPDGKLLISGGEDTTIRIWETDTGHERAVLAGHTDHISQVSVSPDGRLIASSSHDNTIRLWYLSDGSEFKTIPVNTVWVKCVAFSPDGTTLAYGAYNGTYTVNLWDLTTGRERLFLQGHKDDVLDVAFSPDGTRLASSASDRSVRVWSLTSASSPGVFEHKDTQILGVAFSPDGRTLATGSWQPDSMVRVYDFPGRRLRHTLTGHSGHVASLGFAADGRTLLSCDGVTLKTWDAIEGKEIPNRFEHPVGVVGVASSPDGRELVTLGTDRRMRFWNFPTGELVATHSISTQDGGYTVGWTSLGTEVARVEDDGTMLVFDAHSGKRRAVILSEPDTVYSLILSADGQTLVVYGESNLTVWNLNEGRQIATLPRHAVAISPDGRTLATVDEVGFIHFWDPQTGHERASFRGHEGQGFLLRFSPDGNHLLTGALDKSVRIWEALPSDGRHTSITHPPATGIFH